MNWSKATLHLFLFLELVVFLSLAERAQADAAPVSWNIKPYFPTLSPLSQIRHRYRRRWRYRLRGAAHEPKPISYPQSRKDKQIKPSRAAGDGSPIKQQQAKQAGSLPRTEADGSQPTAAIGPPPPPDHWTDAEISNARADCDRSLSGLSMQYVRLDPIKEGACGTPAPIRLSGFNDGHDLAATFAPAPTLTCKLAAALSRWFKEVIEPKAMDHLKSPIVKITTLSAYNCRSRYDDSTQRLSQHAYANAIDISELITAKGEHVTVLDNWHSSDERAAFLRDIHEGACRIFGTTLGPEANEAHKNHFHLDMTDRRQPLCDFTPEQIRKREESKRQSMLPK